MKSVRYSTKARKDLKRYRNDAHKMRLLYEVLEFLVRDIILPPRYKAHPLSGDYKDCLECHVGNDFLLIWRSEDAVEILRLGSHSELFGNGRNK